MSSHINHHANPKVISLLAADLCRLLSPQYKHHPPQLKNNWEDETLMVRFDSLQVKELL